MKIPLPPPDKLGHFFWGSIVGMVASGLVAYLWTPYWAGEVGIAAAGAVGWAKERLDARSNAAHADAPKHGVEVMDIIWTAIGGAVSAGHYDLLKLIVKLGS